MTTALQSLHSQIALHDTVIRQLKTLNRKAFLQYAIDVGQQLVEAFFDGDFNALHDKNLDKQANFQVFLVERKDELSEMDLSGNTLRNYVAAAEVAHTLPKQLVGHLGLTHLSQLAIVRDAPERARLAHEAASMQWTKQQVATAVREWKDKTRHGKRAGPKHKPEVLKAAVAMHAAMRRLHHLHGAATQLNDEHKTALKLEIKAATALLKELG